jgi:hypothetical protein
VRLATLGLVGFIALTTAATGRATAAPPPLPPDVQHALADFSIGVVDARDVPAKSLPVSRRAALHAARHRTVWGAPPALLGWRVVPEVKVYLVRLTERLAGSKAAVKTDPLVAGDLAWLVIVRNAEIPLLGPPDKAHMLVNVAVLVQTTTPNTVASVAF